MGELRRPFLVLALLAAALVVSLEVGSNLLIGGGDASGALARTLGGGQFDVEVGTIGGVHQPPGRGIGALALIDVVVLFTAVLFVLGWLVPGAVHGRVQGIATLIGSIVLILTSLGSLVAAFVELMVMVTLLPAVPFGTIAYLAMWGFFPVADAATLLGLLLALKLAFAVLLLLAQPRFLQNTGLVVLTATTMVATVVLAFLHGWVPVILVSIVDGIAAIVFAILALIVGIVLLIGSIPAILKAVSRRTR